MPTNFLNSEEDWLCASLSGTWAQEPLFRDWSAPVKQLLQKKNQFMGII